MLELFPEWQRRELTNPPIELIVAQVRFPLVVELLEIKGIGALAHALKATFPLIHSEENITATVSPTGVSQDDRVRTWRLEDVARNWTLTVAPDFLALETKHYQSFDEFRDKFESATREFARAYNPAIRTRLGLRYVDRVSSANQPHLPAEWISLINPKIFAMRNQERVDQTGRLEQRFKLDDMTLTFRAFFVDEGFGGADQTEFVLDLDCYDTEQGDFHDIATRLDQFKAVTHNAFGWALGDLLEKWGACT